MNAPSFVASSDFMVRTAADEEELNYVRKTWLRSFGADAWPAADFTFGPRFMVEHHRCVDSAIERGAVLVACRPDLPTRICGFAVTGLDDAAIGVAGGRGVCHTLHFVHVRRRWRRLGVARLLLCPLLNQIVDYTHRTLMLQRLRLPESWTFNPYPFLRS